MLYSPLIPTHIGRCRALSKANGLMCVTCEQAYMTFQELVSARGIAQERHVFFVIVSLAFLVLLLLP